MAKNRRNGWRGFWQRRRGALRPHLFVRLNEMVADTESGRLEPRPDLAIEAYEAIDYLANGTLPQAETGLTVFDSWADISAAFRLVRRHHSRVSSLRLTDHAIDTRSGSEVAVVSSMALGLTGESGLLPRIVEAYTEGVVGQSPTSYFSGYVEEIGGAVEQFLSDLETIAEIECASDLRPIAKWKIYSEVGLAAEQLGQPEKAKAAYEKAFVTWTVAQNPLSSGPEALESLRLVAKSKIGESRLLIVAALNEVSDARLWNVNSDDPTALAIEFIEVATEIVETGQQAALQSADGTQPAGSQGEDQQIVVEVQNMISQAAGQVLAVWKSTNDARDELKSGGRPASDLWKVTALMERAGLDSAPFVGRFVNEFGNRTEEFSLDLAAKLISGGSLNHAYELTEALSEPRNPALMSESFVHPSSLDTYLISYAGNLLAMLAMARRQSLGQPVGGEHEPQVVASPAFVESLTPLQIAWCEEKLEKCSGNLEIRNQDKSLDGELALLNEQIEQSKSAHRAREIVSSCERDLFEGYGLTPGLSSAQLARTLRPAIAELIVLQTFDAASELLNNIGVALLAEAEQALEGRPAQGLTAGQPGQIGAGGRSVALGLYRKARLVAHELDRLAEAESLQPSETWSALVKTAGRSMAGNGPTTTAAQVRAQNRQARRAVAALGSALQPGSGGVVSH